MYNLFHFLKKYYYILLFVILEVVCIVMLMQSLPYHKRLLVNISNSISGKFFESKTNITDYFSLADENQKLIEHNKYLMTLLYRHHDTITIDTANITYNFIPAQVINNSIYHINNYLLINKGRKDGVKKDMGVICENGIVGKVVNVSENYASVISMLHSYSVVSARFIDNQHIANISWDGDDYRFGLVKDIPYHLKLQKGDTLVTSGFSNVYPADLMIGTIEEIVDNKSEMFSSAKIRFSTNFSTLRNVYIIENLFQEEIDSLTININNNE